MSKKRTYAVAKAEIIERLKALGWTVKAGLKVPHATSPSGWCRLWFKPQSIHFTAGTHHAQGNARALGQLVDIRRMTADQWLDFAERFLAGEWR